MKRTASAATLLLVLLSTAAGAGEPRIGKFVRYDAGDYTIITSRGASQARQFVGDLRKFRITLEKLLGRSATDSRTPTTILVVSARDWTNYLQPREGIAGWFQSVPFANYITIDGDGEPEEAAHIVFHEYTHYYLASQFSGEHPPWFNEGLAEFMGYTSFRRMKGFAVVQIPMFHVDKVRDSNWIPFERLIKVDHSSPEYQSHKLADSFYAQSWLTVHYGLLENRDFGKQMFRYLNQLNALRPHEEAVSNSFGTDFASVDKQLREYARSSKIGGGSINVGEIAPVALPVGEPVAENDAYSILVNLMLETRLAPGRIRPLIEALARREPKSARVAVLSARLAAAEQNQAAFATAVAEAEAALAPGDWLARRDLATVLLRNATDRRLQSSRTTEDETRDLGRAHKWFGEAIVHNKQDVSALWGFGTAATRLDKDLDAAEEALLAAYELTPTSADLAVSLANLNSRRQKPERMVPYLQDAIRHSTNLGMRRWAAETLLDVNKFLAHQAEIDAKNAAQRAAYEKQRADYEKKYGKPKAKPVKGQPAPAS